MSSNAPALAASNFLPASSSRSDKSKFATTLSTPSIVLARRMMLKTYSLLKPLAFKSLIDFSL